MLLRSLSTTASEIYRSLRQPTDSAEEAIFLRSVTSRLSEIFLLSVTSRPSESSIPGVSYPSTRRRLARFSANEPPPAEPVVSGSPLKGGKESSSFVPVPVPVPVPESYDTVGQLKPIESRAACMAVFLVAGRRRERERVRVDAGTAEPYEFSPAEPVV